MPFGQFLRLKRNSSLPTGFYKEEQLLSKQLRARGYPPDVILKAREKTNGKSRESLLEDHPLIHKNRVTCGLEYNHRAEPIWRLIYRHWHLIKHIPGCEEPPFVGLRQTRCIKDILVHSDLTIMNKEYATYYENIKEHKPCGHCTSCRQV